MITKPNRTSAPAERGEPSNNHRGMLRSVALSGLALVEERKSPPAKTARNHIELNSELNSTHYLGPQTNRKVKSLLKRIGNRFYLFGDH